VKSNKQRIFPVHFDKGKTLFHVIVKLSDAPGSYSSVLDLLRTKLNLIGTTTYTLSDGTAMFSGFAEALSPGLTGDEIRELILGSKAAFEVEVKEGRDGLLVDTFHTGFTVDSDEFMLLRTGGMVHMFNRISKILGSGGEALLYDEGLAMGRWYVGTLIRKLGIERVKAQVGALNRFMAAQGWGEVSGEVGPGRGEFTMESVDCFECSGEGAPRKGCNFMRGYFAGAAKEIYGADYECVETACVLKGKDHCKFHLIPKK
jgi:predicted hydrocarbon binding protein